MRKTSARIIAISCKLLETNLVVTLSLRISDRSHFHIQPELGNWQISVVSIWDKVHQVRPLGIRKQL